ncbi:GNAT family N-acetyltransferase [Candidatus Acetothermia bacterium]|nr:GNAT family N-acetyltransferase [Candidatus Acetothermia bacterium]MBI3644137.1 GNAT family N-acetyltransferase [Candidatus Acetothermia bacterium]
MPTGQDKNSDPILFRRADLKDASAIAKVHVDSWRTTYAGIVSDDYLANLSYDKREKTWQDVLSKHESLTFVAETTDRKIVGFVSGGRSRMEEPAYLGEMFAIYLLKEFQGQGIGKRLVQTLVGWFLDQDIDSMMVWVLRKNPACRFYEMLGGRKIAEKKIDLGGQILNECAFGWKDLRVFLPN